MRPGWYWIFRKPCLVGDLEQVGGAAEREVGQRAALGR